LGPREVYVPSYPVSRNYVNNVNVSNTAVNTTVVNNYYNTTVVNQNVNVTNVRYVNQAVPGAVAATTSQAFTTAQPVAKNSVNVDQRAIVTAPVRAVAPASVPTKQAVLGTGAVTVAVKPPAAVQTRVVVAKVAPPPPPPVFEKRQEAIKNNGGKPLTIAQVQQIQTAPTQSAVKIAPQQNAQGDRAPNNSAILNKLAQGQPGQPNKPGQTETKRPSTVITRQENRPSERPANPNDAALHAQQEQEQPRVRQEQERPLVHQQQELEHNQPAQPKADEPKKPQAEQHQQQTAPLQEKHPQEQQKSQAKQQQEGKNQPKPAKDDRPPKDKP
jgi:hypothetical protein